MDRSTSAFLAHYGVKGMKWGVRRRRDGTVERTGRRAKGRKDDSPASQDHKDASKLRSKSVKSLSNKDLKALNERLNLEQNYSRMTQQKNTIDKGHDYVRTAVGMAKTASEIYNLYNSPLGKAVRDALRK